MTTDTPSKINVPSAARWGLFAGIVWNAILMLIVDDLDTQAEWLMWLGFIGWPLINVFAEIKYPLRKQKSWTKVLRQNEDESQLSDVGSDLQSTTPGHIDIASSWTGVPVHWTLPIPFELKESQKNSLASFRYDDGHRWPDDLSIRWQGHNKTSHGLELKGPEDYVAACITPEVQRTLAELCEKYSLEIKNGRIQFDLRYTSRSLGPADIKDEISQFMDLAQSLSIPASEFPQRTRAHYDELKAQTGSTSAKTTEHTSEHVDRTLEHILAVLIRHHGDTEISQATIRNVLADGSVRDKMVAMTAILHRASSGQEVPAELVDIAHSFLGTALEELNPSAAPFADGVDAYLGYLGSERGQEILSHFVETCFFIDEHTQLTAVLFKYCEAWDQWPSTQRIIEVIAVGVLRDETGQEILETIQSMCARAGDQGLTDQIARALLESLPRLSEARTLSAYQLELALLAWIGRHGALALAGPLERFAGSTGDSLYGSEKERAERIAFNARQSRSTLIERLGDGGGRLSILDTASKHDAGGLSLVKDSSPKNQVRKASKGTSAAERPIE